MSRYIEIAYRVDGMPGYSPRTDMPRQPSKRIPVRSIARKELRDVRDVRLSNLERNVARHEAGLAEARTSPARGSRSAGLLLQLARRLHQARHEFAEFSRSASLA